MVTVLISEKSSNRKVKLERDRDTQPPFAHVTYFSPVPMLKGKSASLFRDMTAFLAEGEDAKGGERTECGGKY